MTVLLLARAVALPVVTRRTTLKPVVTGITEAFASFIAFGCIIAAIFATLQRFHGEVIPLMGR